MVSTTLQAMPRGLAFSQDMLLNIPILADWNAILAQREQLFNNVLIHANKNCINFDYQIGQKILNMTKHLQANLKKLQTL